MTPGTRTGTTAFMARLIVTLVLALGAVGALQYALVARTVTGRAEAQLVAMHTADAQVLRDVYGSGADGTASTAELLNHIAARPGVLRVSLVGEDGVVAGLGRAHNMGTSQGAATDDGTADGHAMPDGQAVADGHSMAESQAVADGQAGEGPEHPAVLQEPQEAQHTGSGSAPAVGTTDQLLTVGEAHPDAAQLRSVASSGVGSSVAGPALGGVETLLVRVPVRLGDRDHVLEVVRDGTAVHADVAALQRVQLRTLGLGLLVGVPLFYLLGGRSLNARHMRALEESSTDGLTGLANHRTFHEDLRQEVEQARRHGRPLTLALVDLDGFKQVNDTQGHRQGDRVLAAVAIALRSNRRGERAYRIGGDEFAVVLRDTSVQDALSPLERLRGSVEALGLGVTMSIGVAQLDVHTPDTAALVERSDAALYDAKGRGRNRVVAAAEGGRREPVPAH